MTGVPSDRDRRGSYSATGVFLYDDYRANLIIDQDDPVFISMRDKKREHLRSENSEDAITWNTFRPLSKISPSVWYPLLFARAFPGMSAPTDDTPRIELWKQIAPPASLHHIGIREGSSEVDVLIESENQVWFIEAKYKSGVSRATTYSPGRNQVLRNIDVGSHYAGEREFFFCLLLLASKEAAGDEQLLRQYGADERALLDQLPHRTDGLGNLKGLGILYWTDMADVLEQTCMNANEDEHDFACRAAEWLKKKLVR